ncbi:hypothetical protein BS78_09G116300 [Paspalum vaginatum]|nr:hypothetical protein BS78_09G116300 [Paspalum vaginatum]
MWRALSRRWGSLWRSSGAVNLAARIKENQISSCHEAFVRAAEAALAAAEAPVTRLTKRVEGDYNHTVRGFVHRSGDYWRRDATVVGDLLSHHAARHVEELRVALVQTYDACLFADREVDRSQELCALDSLPSSETLRVLDLTRCDLARLALAPVAFPRLATLRLRLSTLDPTYLEALCDAAPELATVHLEHVFFTVQDAAAAPPSVVVRLSFQTVTELVLASCGAENSSWAVEVDAPRLRSFVYEGMIRHLLLRSPAPDIARADLHLLSHRSYHYGKETTRTLFWQFLRNFSNARTLKLKVDNSLKEIAALGKARGAELLPALCKVERLELEGVHHPGSKTAAVAIASLLHCCPVLRDFTLKLSTVPHDSLKSDAYEQLFLGMKDRLDYLKSIHRFVRRSRRSETTISMEDSCRGVRLHDAPDIPGLRGRSFACLQSSLRRVTLQFRLDSSNTGCLGARLVKIFADNAMILGKICCHPGF